MQTSLARYLPQLLVRLRVWEAASEILGGGGNNAWAIQLHSQYAFDPRCRPLYNLPVTVGYCIGINRVHSKLRRLNREGIAITKKPFLVLTSKGDDVLNGDQTMACAHANGSFPHTLDCHRLQLIAAEYSLHQVRMPSGRVALSCRSHTRVTTCSSPPRSRSPFRPLRMWGPGSIYRHERRDGRRRERFVRP